MARKSKKQRKREKAQKIAARKAKRQKSIVIPHVVPRYSPAGLVALESLEYELQGMPLKLANMFRQHLFKARQEIMHAVGKENYDRKHADAIIGETLMQMPTDIYRSLQRHPRDSGDGADEWGHELLTLLTDDIAELKSMSEQLGDDYGP